MRRISPEYGSLTSTLGTNIGHWSLNGCLSTVIGVTSNTDAAWPSANAAIFMPVRFTESTRIVNAGVNNGSAVSGNFDVGVYTTDGVRIVSSGSTAHSGTGAVQIVELADTLVGPGVYYLAVAMDNTTGQFSRVSLASATFGKVIGLAEMASAFPLPSTATLATSTLNYIPGIVVGTKNIGIL